MRTAVSTVEAGLRGRRNWTVPATVLQHRPPPEQSRRGREAAIALKLLPGVIVGRPLGQEPRHRSFSGGDQHVPDRFESLEGAGEVILVHIRRGEGLLLDLDPAETGPRAATRYRALPS
jgi:hypothetical protein